MKTNGKQHYLGRAVDQDGEEPRKIVTDKLHNYGVAHRELMPDVSHDDSQYANNQAVQSHEPTRVRERVIRGAAFRRFRSVD